LTLRGNPDQFAESDPERTQLMLRAIEGIRDHPILGSGLLSMAYSTSTGEPIVVHNRYLSAWAEMGFLGFLGLCGITFLWLSALPAAITTIRAGDPLCRFNCLWSITMLLQFAVFGLFFPIGVQIDDWGLFMMAETVLTATLGNRANRKVAALSGVPHGSLPNHPQYTSYPTCSVV
jgi:O-antigen ligase